MDTKYIEKMLYMYKEIPMKMKSIDLEIEIINGTYETLCKSSGDYIKESTPMNIVSNSVENALLAKERKIEELEHEKFRLGIWEKMINIAMESLTDQEREIIEDKYFNKLSYDKLGMKHNYTKTWAYATCRNILENKIAEFMIEGI